MRIVYRRSNSNVINSCPNGTSHQQDISADDHTRNEPKEDSSGVLSYCLQEDACEELGVLTRESLPAIRLPHSIKISRSDHSVNVEQQNLATGESSEVPVFHSQQVTSLTIDPSIDEIFSGDGLTDPLDKDVIIGNSDTTVTNTCRSRPTSRIKTLRRDRFLSLDGIKPTSERCSPLRRSKQADSKRSARLTDSFAQNAVNPDWLVEARQEAETAMKAGKIFAILGPYEKVREGLRKRGWVEKFYRKNQTVSNRRPHESCSISIGDQGRRAFSLDRRDQTDAFVTDIEEHTLLEEPAEESKCSEPKSHSLNSQPESSKQLPWLERNGYYSIMSRIVRSSLPRFIWSLRKSQLNFHYLTKEQIVNQHPQAPFTTKIGLSRDLNKLRWISDQDANEFFPRCYIVSDEVEQKAFMDDFHLTACMSVLKLVCQMHSRQSIPADDMTCRRIDRERNPGLVSQATAGTGLKIREVTGVPKRTMCSSIAALSNAYQLVLPHKEVQHVGHCATNDESQRRSNRPRSGNSEINQIGVERQSSYMITFAIAQCKSHLRIRKHKDIDEDICWTNCYKTWSWTNFLTWYSKIVKNPQLLKTSQQLVETCEKLCKKLVKSNPQYHPDGTSNVWIVKPGAMSRGRGIVCCDKLQSIFRLVNNNLGPGDSRLIVQKYIERPLLIYKTKFDIRQWFLVTDWAPLTVWWYKQCYLRFCSQEFTLDDLCESIHLSNNAIQHKYINGPRSPHLPDENMWTIDEFKDWLVLQDKPTLWSEKIEPGMRKSIINSLLCAQEYVEPRKNCFALYGADFVLSDDYRPWLIEINSSPCMSSSTLVTARLTGMVLEDTLKVVLDRQSLRNCDVGHYELIYRQIGQSQFIYVGTELRVFGKHVGSKPVEAPSGSGKPTPTCQSQPVAVDKSSCGETQPSSLAKHHSQSVSSHKKSQVSRIAQDAKHQSDAGIPLGVNISTHVINALPKVSKSRKLSPLQSVEPVQQPKKPSTLRIERPDRADIYTRSGNNGDCLRVNPHLTVKKVRDERKAEPYQRTYAQISKRLIPAKNQEYHADAGPAVKHDTPKKQQKTCLADQSTKYLRSVLSHYLESVTYKNVTNPTKDTSDTVRNRQGGIKRPANLQIPITLRCATATMAVSRLNSAGLGTPSVRHLSPKPKLGMTCAPLKGLDASCNDTNPNTRSMSVKQNTLNTLKEIYCPNVVRIALPVIVPPSLRTPENTACLQEEDKKNSALTKTSVLFHQPQNIPRKKEANEVTKAKLMIRNGRVFKRERKEYSYPEDSSKERISPTDEALLNEAGEVLVNAERSLCASPTDVSVKSSTAHCNLPQLFEHSTLSDATSLMDAVMISQSSFPAQIHGEQTPAGKWATFHSNGNSSTRVGTVNKLLHYKPISVPPSIKSRTNSAK